MPYIGARAGTLSTTVANAQDITATDTTPEVTIVNSTHEDTDGGREGKVIFKGQQSGGEESTLAEIQGSHDGTADDEKGDLIFRTNDGSDGASPTEAMRIDSSQNVGIGCVPNSIQSGFDTLQIGGNLTLNVDSTGAGAGVYMGNNVYRDSGNSRWEYSYTDEASQYLQAGGEHIWRYAASGTADTAITWSEAMRINSSGNIGVGIAAPLRQLHISNTSANSEIAFTAGTSGVSSILFGDGQTGTDVYRGYLQYNHSDDAMLFASSATERMRIDSSGVISFHGISGRASGSTGHLSISEQNNNRSYVESCSTTTSSTTLVAFRNPNGTVGSITTSGSNTAFNTSSDYRLKENVTNVTDGITRVKQLAPKRFNFIADADTIVDGFLAHEAATVVPEAVFGTHNEVEVWEEGEELPDGVSVGDNKLDDDGNTIPKYQGIDQSKLVPLLTAALQEAIAKIETLETQNTTQATQIADLITRVTALEAE